MEETYKCFLCECPIRLKTLDIVPPSKEDFDCITCLPCDRKHNFLRYYSSIYSVPYDTFIQEAHSSKVMFEEEEKTLVIRESTIQDDDCILGLLKTQPIRRSSKMSFWPENWTKQLCKCDRCKKTYMDEGLSSLVNDFDELLKIVNENPTSEEDYSIENHEFIETYFEKYLSCYSPRSNVIRKEDIEAFHKIINKRYIKI